MPPLFVFTNKQEIKSPSKQKSLSRLGRKVVELVAGMPCWSSPLLTKLGSQAGQKKLSLKKGQCCLGADWHQWARERRQRSAWGTDTLERVCALLLLTQAVSRTESQEHGQANAARGRVGHTMGTAGTGF